MVEDHWIPTPTNWFTRFLVKISLHLVVDSGWRVGFNIQSDLSITRFLGVPDFRAKNRVIERSVLYRGFQFSVEGPPDEKLLAKISRGRFYYPK